MPSFHNEGASPPADVANAETSIDPSFHQLKGSAPQYTGTISIGSVTAGDSPEVSNSGTLQDAVLDFVIPRGAQGIAGPWGSILGTLTDQVDLADALDAKVAAADLAAATGASMVGFKAPGVSAIEMAVYDVLNGLAVTPEMYGAVGDGVTDDTVALQEACTAAAGRALYIPGRTYLQSDAIVPLSNTRIFGNGVSSLLKATSLVDFGANGGQRQLDIRNVSGVVIEDLNFDNSLLTVFGSGTRNIYCYNSHNIRIRNCRFTTCGAAVASVGCYDYKIIKPDVTCSSTDGVTHNDGVIDNWGGSHDFEIDDAIIDGGGIGKYGIVITGQNTDNSAAACYQFKINHPLVKNVINVGVWSSGRNGVNYNFQINSPMIDTVTAFHGIEITDSKRWVISLPIINNTQANAIRIGMEAGQGTYSCTDGTIIGGAIEDTNMGLSASDLSGSAIAVSDSCQRIQVVPGAVKGTNHRYAVYFLPTTSNCELIGGGALQKGTQGTVFNTTASNRTPGYNTYIPAAVGTANVAAVTPRVTRFKRVGDVVEMDCRIEITPTAGGNTDTKVEIPPPIASAFTDATADAFGVMTNSFNVSAAVFANTANGNLIIRFPAPNTAANTFYGTMKYVVK